jgi:predicted ATPase
MLKSIRLQNFKSFKDTTITFNAGLNVLIGLNGSGKTNVLLALKFLTECFKTNGNVIKALSSIGGFENCRNWGEENDSISFDFTLSKDFLQNRM